MTNSAHCVNNRFLARFAHRRCCYGVYYLLLVFTYQGRYCSEPPLAFPWTEVSKAAKRLMMGRTVPQIPLSVGSKLELLLRAFVFAQFSYTSLYTHAFVRVCILVSCICIYVYIILISYIQCRHVYMTEGPWVCTVVPSFVLCN